MEHQRKGRQIVSHDLQLGYSLLEIMFAYELRNIDLKISQNWLILKWNLPVNRYLTGDTGVVADTGSNQT